MPSTAEAAEKNFALSERSEFAKFRQLRGAQGSPKGQGARVPFLLVPFLWANKEKEQEIARSIVALRKALNTAIKIFVSLLAGAACSLVFFSLYGIIASIDANHYYMKFVSIASKELKYFASLTYSFIIDIISAIPPVFIAGTVLGYIVREKPILFGLMASTGFFLFETIYSSLLSERLTFIRYDVNVWYCIVSVISWIALFILTINIGILIHRRFMRKSHNFG